MLFFFLSGKSTVRISIRSVSRKPGVYWTIIKTGLHPCSGRVLASIATVALNVSAAVYGDAAVAAMSIVGRIMMLIGSAMIGFGQGYMPVVGFNYGAKLFNRVRQAFRYALVVERRSLTVLGGWLFTLAPQLMALFRADDQAVIEIGAFAMRAQCLDTDVPARFRTLNGRSRRWGVPGRQLCLFLPPGRVFPAFHLSAARPLWADRCGNHPDSCRFRTFLCCIPFLVQFFPGSPERKKTWEKQFRQYR